MMKRSAALSALVLLAGCVSAPAPAPPPIDEHPAIEAALRAHIAILASDEFEGRQPGTAGEEKTLRYLSEQWQAAGLESGTNDPAHPWFAPVELLRSIPRSGEVAFSRNGRRYVLPPGSATVFTSGRRALVEQAPLIFVGREGEGIDRSQLAGRVALMDRSHPAHHEQRDALLENGAAAVLSIVADPEELKTLVAERRRGTYRLAGLPDGDELEGFISREAADRLLGRDRMARLMRAAASPSFRAVVLPASVSLEATSGLDTVRSSNLIGRLPGTRPGSGAVLLLAHWDHFGRCRPAGAADSICNGAVDNASGLAVLTELANRLGSGPPMARDVYFLATTAEEWGLLGAQAFTRDPPIFLDTIVAAFNLDSVAVAPRGSPVAIVADGMTALDPILRDEIERSGRRLGDSEFARRYVRRQDGWALLRRDVPAVMVSSAFAQAEPLERFTRERYHSPADEVEGIDLGGAADDLLLHVALVRRFANEGERPATRELSRPAH